MHYAHNNITTMFAANLSPNMSSTESNYSHYCAQGSQLCQCNTVMICYIPMDYSTMMTTLTADPYSIFRNEVALREKGML